MDRFSAMTAFVRVVEAGTFTRAADTLGLPNATVTRLVQALEEDLRLKLLHRSTRAVRLTAEGAAYYERVVGLLADLADIETSARQALSSPEGRVRVEIAGALGTEVLIPALAGFYREYPGIQVDLGVGNRFADVVAEGVDCAIRIGELADQSLVARRVGEFQMCTCAAPALLEAHGAPVSPDDLARWPTVGMRSVHGLRALPFRFSVAAGQVKEYEFGHRLVVNDTMAWVAAGLAGLGIIQAPTYAVHAAIAERRLVPILDDWCTPGIAVSVVYAPNRYLSAKVRVFIDWVVLLFEQFELLQRGKSRC
jgi:DNA-binding transcriptional LysR family regulator